MYSEKSDAVGAEVFTGVERRGTAVSEIEDHCAAGDVGPMLE